MILLVNQRATTKSKTLELVAGLRKHFDKY